MIVNPTHYCRVVVFSYYQPVCFLRFSLDIW
jgi:hypothetical protein